MQHAVTNNIIRMKNPPIPAAIATIILSSRSSSSSYVRESNSYFSDKYISFSPCTLVSSIILVLTDILLTVFSRCLVASMLKFSISKLKRKSENLVSYFVSQFDSRAPPPWRSLPLSSISSAETPRPPCSDGYYLQ